MGRCPDTQRGTGYCPVENKPDTNVNIRVEWVGGCRDTQRGTGYCPVKNKLGINVDTRG